MLSQIDRQLALLISLDKWPAGTLAEPSNHLGQQAGPPRDAKNVTHSCPLMYECSSGGLGGVAGSAGSWANL